MSFTDEVYPNAPLVEVVFEIRFPGELVVECERHRFWQNLREQYPKILVPHASADQALALVPYRFKSEDENLTISIALNRLSLSIRNYQGFAEFKKEITRVFDIFGDTYGIGKLNRVGWRYVNIIPYVREDDLIPLQRLLTLGFKVPKSVPERFDALNFSFNAKRKEGTVTIKVESLIKEDGGQEALLLDFDYGKEDPDLHFNKYKSYLEEAHSFTRELFEDFITGEYREFLRGNIL